MKYSPPEYLTKCIIQIRNRPPLGHSSLPTTLGETVFPEWNRGSNLFGSFCHPLHFETTIIASVNVCFPSEIENNKFKLRENFSTTLCMCRRRIVWWLRAGPVLATKGLRGIGCVVCVCERRRT